MISSMKRFALLLAAVSVAHAAGKLNVVAATQDLASIAEEVGGDRITVDSIAKGYQDPHFVEPKPSFLLKLQKADLLLTVGLQLEIGWLPPLIDQSRNAKIRPGGAAYLDASLHARILDMPQGTITRALGDVHPLGNPHYWLDPENGRRIARLFKAKFTELDAKNAAVYDANERAFEAKLNAAEKAWAGDLATIRGKPVVAWHTSWRYFAEYTGMNIVAFMEPKPGVPPSPSHLYTVIQAVKRTGAKAIIMEPFYDRKVADLVAKQTGIKVLLLPPSVGGIRGAPVNDYVSLMTYDMAQLAAAVK